MLAVPANSMTCGLFPFLPAMAFWYATESIPRKPPVERSRKNMMQKSIRAAAKKTRARMRTTSGCICGDGNFIDNVLGADYITHQIRENLYEIFIANKKIAYTDDGFALVAAGVFAALNRAVELHIIATDPEDDTGVYTVVIPKRADATDEQARNRQMPDIKWSAQLEGAVHSVKVNGTLRVTLNG
ncbi:MAG TPA: hypothetical protein DHV95_08540 [Faecalibacterium sp.]|nr:hypothetical protein [Faecalibacterium sp.]